MRVALLGARSAISSYARPILDRRAELVIDSERRVNLGALRDAKPDLIVAAAHEYIVGPKMRATARLGAVGLHPSLLPQYRGSYPLWWALWNGEHRAGLSLYHLTDGIDEGNVIAQRAVGVERGDTFAKLYERVARRTPDLLAELLDAIEQSGSVPVGTPQDETMATRYPTPSLKSRAWLKVRLRLLR